MACNCHGKDGKSVVRTSAYDQCTTCARKHIKNAWSKWNQFTYEQDNRQYVSAQLRDAADHIKYTHKDIALQLRDVAVVIQQWKDIQFGNVAQKINDLRLRILQIFYDEHPEIVQKRQNILQQKQREDYDTQGLV